MGRERDNPKRKETRKGRACPRPAPKREADKDEDRMERGWQQENRGTKK